MDLFRCPIFYFMSDSFTAPFSHHLSIELYRIIWCFIHFEFSTNPLFMLLYSNLWSYIELYEISNKTTIPSFISCYTYPEILYFQGFLPFSIFLLHNLLHNFQGAFDSLNLFDLLVLGHMDVQVHRNTYIGMT